MVRTRGGYYAGGPLLHVQQTTSTRIARAYARVEEPPQQAYSWLVKKKRTKIRHTCKDSYSTAVIKMLPRDILVEVVAIVASHSLADFHTMKTCCKDFLDATEDNYVWRKVSLDTLPLIQWLPNDKASSFLDRCKESGNMESLYREGLRKYFNYPNEKIDGLEILKTAAEKGHKEAKYVCGMILLCSEDDELRKQGLECLSFMRNSKCVLESRNKVKQLLNSVWKSNGMLSRNQSPLCNSKSTCKGWRIKNGGWILVDEDDDNNINSCEYCRWDHELECFYQMLNVR